MSEQFDIDFAIVGGGIIGLFTAYEILSKFPDSRVAVLEKELFLGEHTTSRNSEVLHAGIYYENQSQKHLHCLEGNQLWRAFVQKHNIPFLDCGKFIVAKNDETNDLDQIEQKAKLNQVPGMRAATATEINELRNYIRCDKALFSKSSGVLDISSALKILRHLVESMGGIILNRSLVQIAEFKNSYFKLKINDDIIVSQNLINAAGLFAVDLRSQLNLTDHTNYYVKGNYLQLTGTYPAKNLIYPIPPKHGLGLGVHLTLDINGQAKFGPDTEKIEVINYQIDESLKSKMSDDIQRLFFTVDVHRLNLGYSGIRPKVKKHNDLQKDFIIQNHKQHGIEGYIELLGIESPGLTAAPSIARHVVGLI